MKKVKLILWAALLGGVSAAILWSVWHVWTLISAVAMLGFTLLALWLVSKVARNVIHQRTQRRSLR